MFPEFSLLVTVTAMPASRYCQIASQTMLTFVSLWVLLTRTDENTIITRERERKEPTMSFCFGSIFDFDSTIIGMLATSRLVSMSRPAIRPFIVL